MTLSGTLETFCLSEILQIIDLGEKSGRLKITISAQNTNPKLQGVFELWFDKGNFVTIINSRKYQFLTSQIQNNGWIEARDFARGKVICSTDQELGTCFQEQHLLTASQLDSLFEAQVNESIKLFDVKSAWFKFEEIDNSNQITDNFLKFPLPEMTGRQKKATELSLEAMRNLVNWSSFAEEIPSANSGLQRLTSSCNLNFTLTEKHLCNIANGYISLKETAQKTKISIAEVQQTALSMILAGLVEEVPVVSMAANTAKTTELSQKYGFSNQQSLAANKKSKVSNSLVNNLVNFLRNNF